MSRRQTRPKSKSLFSNKQIKQIGTLIAEVATGLTVGTPAPAVASSITKAAAKQVKGVKRGVTTKRVTAAAGKRVNVKKKKGPAGKYK